MQHVESIFYEILCIYSTIYHIQITKLYMASLLWYHRKIYYLFPSGLMGYLRVCILFLFWLRRYQWILGRFKVDGKKQSGKTKWVSPLLDIDPEGCLATPPDTLALKTDNLGRLTPLPTTRMPQKDLPPTQEIWPLITMADGVAWSFILTADRFFPKSN